MLIAGEWVPARSGDVLNVENPATRTMIAEVPRANSADVNRAAEAAGEAFVSWRRVPAVERGRALLNISRDMETHGEELARMIATETGNALCTHSRPEAHEGSNIFRYFGGLVGEIKGETLSISVELFSY